MSATMECLIVLGAQVDENAQPSDTLKRRLLCTLGAAHLKPQAAIILCGGQTGGTNCPTEARVMADHLIQNGLAPERLILEDHSKNTLENAVFARKIIRDKGWEEANLYVISDGYHLLRARLIFQSIGLSVNVISAPPSPFIFKTALSYGREVLSLIKWAIRWANADHKKLLARCS